MADYEMLAMDNIYAESGEITQQIATTTSITTTTTATEEFGISKITEVNEKLQNLLSVAIANNVPNITELCQQFVVNLEHLINNS